MLTMKNNKESGEEYHKRERSPKKERKMMTEHIRYGSWSTRNIPDAKKIILVYDNLNTHNVSPLY